MVACMLNLWKSSTTVLSIGKEHLSWETLWFRYLNRLTIIIKYFVCCQIWLDLTCQLFFLHRKNDFHIFCCIPCFVNSCMDEVYVGTIHNTLLDSNGISFNPHTLQTAHFCNINENKISNRETPVELLSLEPQWVTEPLLISSTSIIWHSAPSFWIWKL